MHVTVAVKVRGIEKIQGREHLSYILKKEVHKEKTMSLYALS